MLSEPFRTSSRTARQSGRLGADCPAFGRFMGPRILSGGISEPRAPAPGDLKPRFVPEFSRLFSSCSALPVLGGEVGLALAITVCVRADHGAGLPWFVRFLTARSRRSNGPFLPRWSVRRSWRNSRRAVFPDRFGAEFGPLPLISGKTVSILFESPLI